ncbi:MAG: SPOR domain-containing protein [Candidatus Omnitrophica bacterium]|nr:SPOR domain-containing protein [Candidatus Omnitrophota bacterium]
MFKKIVLFIALVVWFGDAYCLNLDKMKVNFLSGDYKSAISEGERILSGADYLSQSEELYYILGLSYLKIGNYLRASDIFEIIIKEFKNSIFKDDALLALGDAYFLSGDYQKAGRFYQELIQSEPYTKLQAALYYRLSQIEIKRGNLKLAKEYLDKLKEDFPLSPEARADAQQLYSLSGLYYAVQVGSFINPANAKNLCRKLIDEGYEASIQEVAVNNSKAYRVRVGKFKLRPEAAQLEKQLSSQGYPTKIYP